MELNKEQIEFLDQFTKGRWTLNEETGLVDIEGDFDCCRKNLTDFKGVRFGVVTGDFYCHDNSLTSLEGAPQEVGKYFDCSNNSLTSLVGAPKKVGRSFYCSNNSLTNLVGAPKKVRGDFYCHTNKLTSLVGAPQKVGETFDCSRNKLTSLEGAPQEVGWWSDYTRNQISHKTLVMVWNTMREKKIDYWVALCMLKDRIKSRDWEKMSRGLDDRLSKDTQKGISVLRRFGHFN